MKTLAVALSLAVSFFASAADKVEVKLDVSEVPELKKWGENAKTVIEKWHQRIANLIPTKNFTPPKTVTLKIQKSEKGIGWTSGTTITISSNWIKKHPDDIGLVVHELVHVIQAYPNAKPIWLTEGIADYLRWAIFEGKPQSYFPRPKKAEAYKKGYQITGGFLLWLETGTAPGIVKKLNTAMRNGTYSADLFKTETQKTLDQLWAEYVGLE